MCLPQNRRPADYEVSMIANGRHGRRRRMKRVGTENANEHRCADTLWNTTELCRVNALQAAGDARHRTCCVEEAENG